MNKKNKLIIIGLGGHGKVVADIAMKMNKWNEISFLDDNEKIHSWLQFKRLGTTKEVYRYIDEYDIFVAIGDNNVREGLQETLKETGANIATIIHPEATIGLDVKVGEGTVIMAGVIINSCTSIGKGCIINTASTVDHDCIIKNYVHISPGVNLAGNVKVGQRTWLGIGSTVINNISITEDCIIGAGGAVIENIENKGTYVGVCVRRL